MLSWCIDISDRLLQSGSFAAGTVTIQGQTQPLAAPGRLTSSLTLAYSGGALRPTAPQAGGTAFQLSLPSA